MKRKWWCQCRLEYSWEGEAPAEPLTANGSPGGSPSHSVFMAVSYQLFGIVREQALQRPLIAES